MFTYFRKFINKWKINQGIYIELTSLDAIIPLNKEDKKNGTISCRNTRGL